MTSALRTASRWMLAALFVAAGANHFWHALLYVRVMPPYLPQPLALVYISGLAEIVLGAALLGPAAMSRWAAWGLITLLVAVFPANVHMALHATEWPMIPPWLLWARLPLQGVLIAWVYYTR